MLMRLRLAIGVALVALLLSSLTAFAKGGFDFITITGPGIKDHVQITDPLLTEDFFTFANFYEDKTQVPVDPGTGYEITRHYVQGVSDVIFDRLHYYPETGYVFYDGIENGESEYDGEWYVASPEIKSVFESALVAPVEQRRTAPSASRLQSDGLASQAIPVASKFPSWSVMLILMAAGLAGVFTALFWRRKTSTQ